MSSTRVRISIIVAVLLLTTPSAVRAQPVGKVYRIGMLETRSTALNAANIDAFRQGLRELGYKRIKISEILYRSSDGRDQRHFPGLASELGCIVRGVLAPTSSGT